MAAPAALSRMRPCSPRPPAMSASTASASSCTTPSWSPPSSGNVMDECLQLFGGYGYMKEYPIARMWRDARVQRIYGGTNEIMKLLIARSL
ncbi:acyl-CoA dehydrogenase family protein [Mesorhizobium sp. VK3E]|uniref:Acyl-CoA dehydrogenase family protein n=1 Tax=Mesorhizobium australafricanum TaxID=3072311 RepID=A0ABU4X846_9HYPH|nr:acyl-CoA dehydrogenase family protein [Mesorhizobium sp. VK3E]MDX8443317.1 acyl-CoA dehydrogenase family protein [Mesorhizobium sp. VK3E]